VNPFATHHSFGLHHFHVATFNARVIGIGSALMAHLMTVQRTNRAINDFCVKKERAAGSVAVRVWGNADLEVMPVDEFVAKITADIPVNAELVTRLRLTIRKVAVPSWRQEFIYSSPCFLRNFFIPKCKSVILVVVRCRSAWDYRFVMYQSVINFS
jgi:hypothetical protein